MPVLMKPAVATGSLGAVPQPSFEVGGGVVLRPWLASDAPAVRAVYQDPAIQRWHVRRADTVAEAEKWLGDWRRAWDRETGGHWAVASAEPDTLLGRIAVKFHDLEDGAAEIAYWTTPAARGRGLCTRAVEAVTEWTFTEAGFHRIEILHSTRNAASCRVATKAGYPVESTRRGASLHQDGWHDMHVHVRLSDEAPPTA